MTRDEDESLYNGKLKKMMAAIEGAYAVHEASAMIHIEPLARQFMDDPDAAITKIVSTYHAALDSAYTDEREGNVRAFIEAIAGGPHEAVPWALYNSLGAVYPLLERPQKDKALGEILAILDSRNYLEVNGTTSVGHTTGIREPLLLTDIVIARPIYWPGLQDEKPLWERASSFYHFKEENMDQNGMFLKVKVKSDFLVAYGLLRKDQNSFGAEYVESANPEFLEGVVQGIVALRLGGKRNSNQRDTGIPRLKQLLPEALHDRLEIFKEKADWVDYKKFNR